MGAPRTWTDAQLKEAAAASISMAEVARRLGLKVSGGMQTHLSAHSRRLGLDLSHFKGQGHGRGQYKRPDEVAASLLPLLRKGTEIGKLRNRLIASGLKQAKCEECGLTEWRRQPVPLQVDHVDGDNRNNELENLRMLCANCHMLTETWGFKKGRRRPVQALVA
jgi:hypothetical protein